MKFSIGKEKLGRLLYLASSVVERRNTMPILANANIKAEKSGVTIAATDLEISLLGKAEANVETEGSITVDARVFYDIVRELSEGDVQLKKSKAERLDIVSGQSRFKINGTSSDEFPSIAGIDLERPVTVDAGKIREMLERTSYAVSTDETRFNLNGVYVETVEGVSGKQLRFVATDGHRLAMIDRPAEGFTIPKGVIIPRKGIQELRKLLDDQSGAAKVGVSEGFFTLETDTIAIGIRLVDGQFPDYRQVIPVEQTASFSVPRKDLFSAVRRVSLVTTDKSKTLKFRLDGGNLVISSSSPEYGEATETLAVEQEGENISIGFSAKYLLDLFGAMPQSEAISVKLNGQLGPAVFRGNEDEEYTCIVMPMRFE